MRTETEWTMKVAEICYSFPYGKSKELFKKNNW